MSDSSSTPLPDWDAIRQEFPALREWTYLNSATFGQLPARAVSAMNGHFAHRDALACGDFLEWFAHADRIRGKVARLVNCTPGDVAFVPNAASALAILIAGIRWQPGDNMVTQAGEFPNYLYLSAHAEQVGVEYRQAPPGDPLARVDERTRLVAVSEVNYSSGLRLPLEPLSRELQSRGVALFVDGTQSTGALRYDGATAPVDLFAVHGYKWLLAPTGAGFAIVPPATRAWLRPSIIGWRSHKDWRRVDTLHEGIPEFPENAERYEGAMLPFPLLYGMEASLDLMLETGPSAIEQRVLSLADQVRDILRRAGAEVPVFDPPSQIATGRFSGKDVSALARSLREEKVLVAARHGYLRVSPHFYNNQSDLDRFESVLGRLLRSGS
jgi:selenocysteine lyase/cysteine desulfurase